LVAFLISIFIWGLGLFFLRPSPADLRESIPGYWESFRDVKGAFWLGVIFILAFFIFSGGAFYELEKHWLLILGSTNFEAFKPLWFVQAVTSNFININWQHLWVNLLFLGVLSIYERRVGARRFLTIFILSGIFSSTSVFFSSEVAVSVGSSGGLAGVAAAFILDVPKLKWREYALGLSIVVLLLGLSTFPDNDIEWLKSEVDTLAHFMGLLCGAAFCRCFPING